MRYVKIILLSVTSFVNTPIYSQFWDNSTVGLPKADASINDSFGSSISIDGSAALVGVPLNGDGQSNSGKCVFFEREGNSWVKKSEAAHEGDISPTIRFGSTVLLKDDYAFIGGPGRNTETGAVYIYKKSGLSWENYTELDVLIPDDIAEFSSFGTSLAFNGTTLVVGATGVKVGAVITGAVYVYDLVGSTFQLRDKILEPSGAASYDMFGVSVAIDAQNIFVGSRYFNNGRGAVFIYDTQTLALAAHLSPSNSMIIGFGSKVGVSGDDIAVSAPDNTNSNNSYGVVYIFSKKNGAWHDATEDFSFYPQGDVTAYGTYGSDFSFLGDYLLVGSKSGLIVDLIKKGVNGWADATVVTSFQESSIATQPLGYQKQYGGALAFSDGDILIGAPNLNILGQSSGAVFAYRRDGTEWTSYTRDAIYYTSFNAADDEFGTSVDLFGNYAVVGAPGDDTNGNLSGAAYIYEMTGTSWSQVAKLTPSDGSEFSYFGQAVSITDERVIVSAYKGDGQVYVFEKPAGGWKDATENAIVKKFDTSYEGSFGYSVDAFGNQISIAQYTSGNSESVGRIYIFDKDGTSWKLTATLTGSASSDARGLGGCHAFNGQTVVAGARLSGDSRGGAAFVFERPSAGWVDASETAILTPSDPVVFGAFGSAVDVDQNTIVIGCPQGLGGLPGAVYVFEKKNSSWVSGTENARLNASYPTTTYFGRSVSISGDYVVVASKRNDGEILLFRKQNGVWKNSMEYDILDPSIYGGQLGSALKFRGDFLIVGAPKANSEVGGSSGVVGFFVKQPTVLKVTSSTPDGTYYAGNTIDVQVVFSQPIKVTGSIGIQLAMVDNTTRQAAFDNITDATATFKYVVQENDSTPDLNYVDQNSLKGAFTAVSSFNGQGVLTALPDPLSENSLGQQKQLTIDGDGKKVIPPPPSPVTGVSPEVINGVRVYPNPFYATLVIEGDDIVNSTLMNTAGATVSTTPSLTVEDLPAGIYILQVQTGNSVATFRVIKQNQQ